MPGGRVVGERVTAEPQVEYRISLETDDAKWSGRATIATDGTVTIEVEGAPPWLLEFARKFLRDEWRARQKEPVPWPRRINRWRAEK